VVATHYEGDPCDNTKKFFKWLKKLVKESKASKPFTGMKYMIFGLGDTSYELYNEMGKYFDTEFEALGAERIYEMECGNAETFTTEEDFNNWKGKLWQSVSDHYSPFDTTTPEEKVKR
jgi:NADPH-ferrihemoprotein reductase